MSQVTGTLAPPLQVSHSDARRQVSEGTAPPRTTSQRPPGPAEAPGAPLGDAGDRPPSLRQPSLSVSSHSSSHSHLYGQSAGAT